MNPELQQRIQQELQEMVQIINQTEQFLSQLDKPLESTLKNALISAIALNLHSFYTGAERIFEAIAKQIDGSVPTGQNWHRQLLEQMSVEIPELRPALISDDTRAIFDELRRFRHVVRSVYAYQLDGDRVLDIAQRGFDRFSIFTSEIQHFLTL